MNGQRNIYINAKILNVSKNNKKTNKILKLFKLFFFYSSQILDN